MKHLYLLLFLILAAGILAAQTIDTSYKALPEITVRAYFKDEPLLTAPESIAILDSLQLKNHPDNSLLSAMNTTAGVRMEERSPLSYRLSIRGSILRSPFGVRDVKVYLDDFSLTDAAGNTYINLLDPTSVSHIEILKGPEGSIYGANTGGVVIISPVPHPADSLAAGGQVEGGSYGYFSSKAYFQKIVNNYLVNATLSYQRADGYRQNSSSSQWTSQIWQRWHYSKKAALKVYLLFTDQRYQTPGGLTLGQFEADPAAARPTSGTIPGTVIQKAAIYNTTIYGGISNEVNISPDLKHVIAVSASHTSFTNPYLTDYEVRSENNIDVRTYLQWSGKPVKPVTWSWVNGVEVQQNISSIDDYGNDKGVKDSIQTLYRFDAGQYFYFSRFSMNVLHHINIEGAVSLNYNWYQYRNFAPVLSPGYTDIKFDVQVMPRLAVSVPIVNGFAWRASASRGYSPPTLSELHPAADVISTGLQAESGWNYETGFRFREKHDFIRVDEVVFYYQLQNAIVSRTDSAGNDFFVNAGGTRQLGFEEQLLIWPVKQRQRGFIRDLQFNAAYTYDHFRFGNYQSGSANYSGNYLTGVPSHSLVSSAALQMPLGFYFFIEYTYVSSLPLDDANNAWANHYNLLQAKAGWRHYFGKVALELYAGVNNILNERYSLGDDINAVGGRYYNAAMPINYYGGVKVGYAR